MATIRDQLRITYRKDGEDHINLSAHFGMTDLGRLTSPDARRRFNIDHLGEFTSPRCFANWMCGLGDENLRHNVARYKTQDVPIRSFRHYFLFAKFHQISANRAFYLSNIDQMNLPWVMYKKHLTGVKEFDRWEDYSAIVKEMVQFVVSNPAKTKPDWEALVPGLVASVNQRIRDIAIFNGEDPATLVDLFDADAVAQERKEAVKQNYHAANKPAKEPAAAVQDAVNDTLDSEQLAATQDLVPTEQETV